MDQFQELLKLLASPIGLVAIFALVGWGYLAMGSSPARWFGVGITMYAASMQKFFDPFSEEEWFPLAGPLETLVQNGRPITIIFLLALLVVAWAGEKRNLPPEPPKLMWPVHAIQVVLLLKMVTGSVSVGFVIQALVVYILVACLGIYGIRQWLASDRNLQGPALALCVTAGCYCLATEYQLRVDPEAAILTNGRLIGTCGNPIHAATLLALCLPGPLYFVAGGGKLPIWGRVVTGILLLPMAHLMFLTGSRAGALMSMISLLCFFRSRVWVGAVAAAIIFAAYALFLDEEQQAATDRITSLEDTRSHVWEAQWNTFLQYPVFGAPVVGERLGFGENSWLALIATAGSLGAAVLVWLLVAIARELRDLWRARRAPGRSSLPFDFCIAGLVSLFVGSFLEAYLLGIITLPILALMLFSASSERLVSGSVVSKPKRLRKVAPALRSRRKEETVAGSHSRP